MDVAGYSRLTELDEEGTLRRLKALQRDVVSPRVSSHGGRIVKTTGDGLLIEFASPVEAVRCALETQREIAGHPEAGSDGRRIRFRVGINLGDVIADGDDLLGDGVNLAARLQELAEPGGACLSRSVRDQVREKIGVGLDDLGERSVKNIERPVRVFAVPATRIAALTAPAPTAAGPRRRVGALAAAGLGALAAIAVTVWLVWPAAAPAPPAPRAAAPAPRLSIVVLPFASLNDDREQEWFADGVTEDLTTELSRYRNLFVIGRGSAMTYKGQAQDTRRIAAELGVRYVLEGSVRRVQDEVRVNAQLIDAQSGGHVWADRIDGNRAELARLSDELIRRLGNALRVEMMAAEGRNVAARRPNELDADQLAARAMAVYLGGTTSVASLSEILSLYQAALARDPDHVVALHGQAQTYLLLLVRNASIDRGGATRIIAAAAARLRELAPHDFYGMWAQLYPHYLTGDFAAILRGSEAIIARYPSSAAAYAERGIGLAMTGRAADAIASIEESVRLSPRDPRLGTWHSHRGRAHYTLGQHREAATWYQRAIEYNPDLLAARLGLVAALSRSGSPAEAKAALAALQTRFPDLTLSRLARQGAFLPAGGHPQATAASQDMLEALRELGLPEGAG